MNDENYFLKEMIRTYYQPEIEKLKEEITNLQQRIDKAIDYIKKEYQDNIIIVDYTDNPITPQDLYGELLNILTKER